MLNLNNKQQEILLLNIGALMDLAGKKNAAVVAEIEETIKKILLPENT